jgi:hypothetical protein
MLNTGMRGADLAQILLSQAGPPHRGQIGLDEVRDLQRADMVVDEFDLAGRAITPARLMNECGAHYTTL